MGVLLTRCLGAHVSGADLAEERPTAARLALRPTHHNKFAATRCNSLKFAEIFYTLWPTTSAWERRDMGDAGCGDGGVCERVRLRTFVAVTFLFGRRVLPRL